MRFLILVLIPLLAPAQRAFSEPHWTSIATASTPFQYFRYGSGAAIEHSTMPHPPYTYHFMSQPAPARTVCPIENRPGVYWFTPAGVSLNHAFAVTNPTEFDVSGLQQDIRGFAVTAAFGGKASGPGNAVEVAYFTDRVCSDGGTEYGFSRDLSTGSILVYWSTFANCGNDSASLCRKTGDSSLGENFSNVQQENGSPNPQHGFRIYGLMPGTAYTYRIYIAADQLHVEVLRDKGGLAACSESSDGRLTPCAFHKTVEPWFPIRQLAHASGFLVTGTQTVRQPAIDPTSEFVVSDMLVGK